MTPENRSALGLLGELEAGQFLHHDSACSVYLAEELKKPCDCGLDRIFPALRARLEAEEDERRDRALEAKEEGPA